MDDRESLELAAKAAGIEIVDWINEGAIIDGDDGWWNPITDDGDALRLVVRLLQLGRWEKPHTWQSLDGWRDDPYAATRRAIVRAAAEVGKNSPTQVQKEAA